MCGRSRRMGLTGGRTGDLAPDPCPILLFRGAGQLDRGPRKEGRIEAIAKHRLLNVPRAGHWVHHDQPGDLYKRSSQVFWKDAKENCSPSSSPLIRISCRISLRSLVGWYGSIRFQIAGFRRFFEAQPNTWRATAFKCGMSTPTP